VVIREQMKVLPQGHGNTHDPTGHVTTILRGPQVRAGPVHIFNVGSTATVRATEFDPGLWKDLPVVLSRLPPPGRAHDHGQT
jgi:thiamine phosphate synthase YjbQ (UPF0047 family)